MLSFEKRAIDFTLSYSNSFIQNKFEIDVEQVDGWKRIVI